MNCFNHAAGCLSSHITRMKEIRFLQENHQLWLRFEQMLDEKQQDTHEPDALADLFVRITDDLSWARTYYPGSSTEKYLNDLAARAYLLIYKNKRERRSRILSFWSEEIPLLMRKNLSNLLITFVIFGLSVWVGIISASHDEGFVRLILGDEYVDRTLDNMSQGDPLGIYKSPNHFMMFFEIALNNARVALVCVLAGILSWIGVAFIQFRNGVMLGAFMYFLSSEGFYRESMLTVWIHGTIEIFCIVVSGAAGLAFGRGLWFPGAWPRGKAFLHSSREALKIGLGLIPFFFLAAFFEGFLTRFTGMHDALRVLIIAASLFLMIGYFIVWPIILGRETSRLGRVSTDQDAEKPSGRLAAAKLYILQSNSRFILLLAISAMLFLLPTLAIIMHFVLGQHAETFTYFFFACCYGLAGLMITLAIRNRTEREENELTIRRFSNRKRAGYEQ
jgi:uncharacterized membrane protein SpoIIM required for sporulation